MAAVNKKLKFVIFQQVNVISLLLQILAAIENCQFSRMRTLNFTFEPHFLNTMELLNSCKHFVRLKSLSSVHLWDGSHHLYFLKSK